jgi:hypothetical protein
VKRQPDLQVSTGLGVQRGLCFGEAFDSVVEGSRKLQASAPVLAWVTDRHDMLRQTGE